MCEPEPAGVLGGVADAAGTLAGAVWAIAKVARWPVGVVFGIPLFLAALWFYKWWLIGFTLPPSAIGGLIMWRLHRRVVTGYAGPSPAMAAELARRGLKPIPATVPGQLAKPRPALPRAMRRALQAARPALPAPAKAITGVVLRPARPRVLAAAGAPSAWMCGNCGTRNLANRTTCLTCGRG